MQSHHYQDLITLFDQAFAETFNTRLIKGGDEPIYLPANQKTPYHQVVFAHGFYASAFHEISHWCIAGKVRRFLVDYGYWYCPDGRSAAVQSEFEVVEIKPQALDWLFCVAANYPFNVSCDNLNGDFNPDRFAFQQKVCQQVKAYLSGAEALPERAKLFIEQLQAFYGTPPLTVEQFVCPESDLDN